VGRTIVATWRPHETTVLHTIHDLGLELQIIFNKEAVMVLPTGVNKATGLRAALREMRLSSHNTAGIGDGENDFAFLDICEFSATVANAVPMLREQMDLVTAEEDGEGAVSFMDRIVETDLEDLGFRLSRLAIPLGAENDGRELGVQSFGKNILLAGSSGGGKSTLATAFLEQLAERQYQFCIIDPEGDYHELRTAVSLGSGEHAPQSGEVLSLLDNPRDNCSVDLVGVPFVDRPRLSREILSHVLDLRIRTGHPHWILADEAHHLFPSTLGPDLFAFPDKMQGILFVTVHPGHVSPMVLGMVSILIVIGDAPRDIIREFCKATGRVPPKMPEITLSKGESLFWDTESDEGPLLFRSIIPREIHERHRLKYAKGDLEPDKSFIFRGPRGKLTLRANNLSFFVQLAEGVDDDTWMYHLRRGDYSRWFCDVIHDDALAGQTGEIERDSSISPAESRRRIIGMIQERYTAPV
jgi:hypothetical protein